MFRIDNRILYGILAVMILMTVVSYASNPNEILQLILTLPGVIVAITFHEYAHAFVATRFGDDTPKRQGRLTLNPLKHVDPIGLFMLIFAHFGWGRPVQIDERNFKSKKNLALKTALIALAGPIMNFIIAIICLIINYSLANFAQDFVASRTGAIMIVVVEMGAVINIGLGVFNLLPIPPLDGSKILISFLSPKAKMWFIEHQYIFYIIFLALFITNITSLIIKPVIDIIYNSLHFVIASMFRL